MTRLLLSKNSSSNHKVTIKSGINIFSLNNRGEYSTVAGEIATNNEIAIEIFSDENFLQIKYVGKIIPAETMELINSS